MNIIIRPIEEKDFGACLDIYNYYIKETAITFEEKILSHQEFSKRIHGILKKYPFLVAEAGGSVLGYAYLDAYNPRSAYRYTADLSIYLDKSSLSGGIGKALYAELERHAVSRGITNIISLITEGNIRSVRFHEKCGFELKGTLDNVGLKFGKRLGVMLYQKSL